MTKQMTNLVCTKTNKETRFMTTDDDIQLRHYQTRYAKVTGIIIN